MLLRIVFVAALLQSLLFATPAVTQTQNPEPTGIEAYKELWGLGAQKPVPLPRARPQTPNSNCSHNSKRSACRTS